MADEPKYQGAYPQLVTKIIASYVSHHNVAPEQIPELISSVQRDAVVCLECGWKGKMLRRHLNTRHGLTGEQYLKRWNLPTEHKLTAPNYSERRSSLARELGLGRGSRQEASAMER